MKTHIRHQVLLKTSRGYLTSICIALCTLSASLFGCEEVGTAPVMDSAGQATGGSLPPPLPGGTAAPPPAGQTTAGMTAGMTPAGEISAGATPAGDVTAGTTPAGEVPAGEVPAGEVPAGEVAGEEIAGETPAGEYTELCDPGTSLGLCEVCDEDGYASLADSDPDCPTLECDGESYRLDDEGRCLREVLGGSAEGYCADIGVCGDLDDQECSVEESEVIAIEGECQEILSCDGPGLPELADLANGALCNEWGVCQNGACNAAAHCSVISRYNRDNFYCDAGETEAGEPTCTFFVSGNGANANGEITCTDFCALSGATCVDGWNNDNNNNCDRGNGNDGCDVLYQTQVCVCSL